MISLTVFKVTVPESIFGPSLILSFPLQKGAPNERGEMSAGTLRDYIMFFCCDCQTLLMMCEWQLSSAYPF